ncbi:MAG: GGDEF domain-containing protein [Hydrogenovibrio sp.]|uniref:GGDEF domain-containing protein n=1 Tax=Hydrogenovibrio sp. TaxID=2065821 RepID=UPI0028705263|nr:GGDEF domain-containing protein [Hydrogenovibrio sp.]MDR9499372.1 GGDEF domain-containing protein [Hydrogenovibrio sp.]
MHLMTEGHNTSGLAQFYLQNLYTDAHNALLAQGRELFEQEAGAAVDKFYDQLMSTPKAAAYLTTDLVQNRLKSELKKWILTTLSSKTAAEVPEVVALQLKIGEVHARIDVPMSLVDSSIFIIKHHLFRAILHSDLPRETQTELVALVDTILMASLSLIDEAYLGGLVESERVSQEYRSHTSAHDIAVDIERVKSGLFSWFTHYVSDVALKHKRLPKSIYQDDAGLWLIHKLPLISGDASATQTLQNSLKAFDELTRQSTDEADLSERFDGLQGHLNEISYLLTHIADRNLASASQKDDLTALVARRFMVPIMQKETQLALKINKTYSVLMIDLDDFKVINDAHGHLAGDKVLTQVAGVVTRQIRVTDYAFRYGGEELMVVLPECALSKACSVAEALRLKVAERPIELEQGSQIKVTCSIGVAEFESHPDFMKVIEAADRQLYKAKHAGKNRVLPVPKS